MEVLILAAVLHLPVTPECQQWLDRVDQESRAAARLVWSPQKERHIKRMNQAAERVNALCYFDSDDGNQVAATGTESPRNIGGGGF